MKLGYFTLTDNPPGYGAHRQDPNRFLLDVIEEIVLAEQLGFNSAWVPEHHFGFFGALPNSAVFLANVAAKTSKIMLGPATTILPLHHPVNVAEQYSILDLVSNGRAVVSVGRGYDKREYDAHQVPFAESREIFDEGCVLLRAAWTETPLTWDGKYYKITEPITILPRPVQKPHPAIYVACFSEGTLRMAATNGFDVIFTPFAAAMNFGGLSQAVDAYKRLARDAGKEPGKVMCSYYYGLASSKADEQAARERMLEYLRGISPALPGDRKTAPPHIAYFVDMVEKFATMKAEELGDNSIVTGSPEKCAEILMRAAEAGIEEVILNFNFAHFGHTNTMRMMERTAKELFPIVEKHSQAAARSGKGVAVSV